MFLKKSKLLNYGDRPQGIEPSIILLHYTGMETMQAAKDRLTDPKIEVSAHYLIDEDGSIDNLVPEDKRAWHAGVSNYRGEENCNDFSIGIELEGADHIPYTEAQYQQLSDCCQALVQHYPLLDSEQITGHCDVSPGRKTDPGDSFDWALIKRLNN